MRSRCGRVKAPLCFCSLSHSPVGGGFSQHWVCLPALSPPTSSWQRLPSPHRAHSGLCSSLLSSARGYAPGTPISESTHVLLPPPWVSRPSIATLLSALSVPHPFRASLHSPCSPSSSLCFATPDAQMCVLRLSQPDQALLEIPFLSPAVASLTSGLSPVFLAGPPFPGLWRDFPPCPSVHKLFPLPAPNTQLSHLDAMTS